MPEGVNYSLNTDEYVLPELRASFASDEFRTALDIIAHDYDLEGERKKMLVDIVRSAYVGQIADDEIPDQIMGKLEMTVGQSLEIYADMYADVLDDLEEQLEDQHTLYMNEHPEEFLPPRPEKRDPHEALADEVVAKSGVSLDDGRMSKRFYDIVLSYIKDVRDDAEMKRMFTKPLKTGGLGLEEDKTATIVLFAKEAKNKVEEKKAQIKDEQEEYERLLQVAKERKHERAEKAGRSDSAEGGPKYSKDDARRIFAGSTEEREALKGYVTKYAASGGPEELGDIVLGLVGEAEGEKVADPLAVTAGLSMMANSGKLGEALADKKFREAVLSRFPEDAAHQARQKIMADPQNEASMSVFLQGFYHWIAGVSEEESARLGLRVVKALQKSGQAQYAQLVAFDMDNGIFVWAK
ncbi:MAG: hypothetical protein U9Q03_01585 [Patescibacteria group bacterium]|nr:hypothetical protein [Patescibacteria group bacterium]